MLRTAKTLFAGLLLFGVVALALPSATPAQIAVGVSIHLGPPVLPVYAQPLCPGPGYLWAPGYWAYGPEGYYWVPGTWVMPPTVGLLWTPGYWGFAGGVYSWHAGYWGPHIGFYGGVNYGFGYGGVGFVGGEWRGGVFHYNAAVTNVNTTIIHNTYRTTIIENTVSHVSFNGAGGINAHATAAEEAAAREHHFEATHDQVSHEHAASQNSAFLASENHGRSEVAATSRAGEFHGAGVVAARHDAAAAHANRPVAHNDRPSSASNREVKSTETSRPNNGHANPSHTEAPHSGGANNKPSGHQSAPKPESHHEKQR